MKVQQYVLLLLCFMSLNAHTRPNTKTVFDVTHDNYTRAQTTNNTAETLVCYMAIDGYKIKYILRPYQRSKWYKATDTRFDYKDFSSWCDYSENHPNYVN